MKILQWAIWGFFGAVIAGIVFVKAGAKGGMSGGQQSAMIIESAGTAVSATASSLEGN
jgi:hypothetical protein